MTLMEIRCEACDEITMVNYLEATRSDPGCWETDPVCGHCDADLETDDADPVDLEELRWANDPRV